MKRYTYHIVCWRGAKAEPGLPFADNNPLLVLLTWEPCRIHLLGSHLETGPSTDSEPLCQFLVFMWARNKL